ncbi:MAG TPA: low temperature requirement protein A, partial [Actinomycetota bacterium]
KKVQEYVGDEAAHDLADALPLLPVVAMFGGLALYLAGLVAFRYRNVHSVNVQRIVAAAALLALIPAAARIPALAALGLLAAVAVGLIVFEAVRFSELRERVRHDEEIVVSHLGGDEEIA